MTKPLVFEKPLGMRDLLPESLAKQRHLEKILRVTVESWGYEEIMTPTLEYYDTVGAASATLSDRMFKLLDKQGHTVVLRPDMTTPIARVVSSLYKHVPLPVRLYYQTNVFRAQEQEAGRNAEFFQTGVELIGEEAVDADAEVIALAVHSLLAAGVPSFTIAVGHVGFVDGLLDEIVTDPEAHARLRQYLHDRDYVGYRQLVNELPLTDDGRRRLYALLRLRGGKNKIAEAHELTVNGKARKAVQVMAALWQALEAYGVTDHLLLDFNLIGDFSYYTGILFEGYAADLGSPLVGGGRYDRLLARFGRPAPATGFAIKMDRLMQVSPFVQDIGRPRRVAVLYTEENRAEALREAQRLREEGRIVVTRLVREPEEAAAWMRPEDETVCLLERRERP